MARIHPTAVVSPRAELAEGVEVGPYCIVDAGVRIGPDTELAGHVVVRGRTTLGARNVVHAFAVLGGQPQIKKHGAVEGVVEGGVVEAGAERGSLTVGDDNVFREHVTVNVASRDTPTRIGSNNLLMASSHVAHDVVIGSNVVLANGVQLAGHVIVEDWVTFGGLSAVAQFLRVGQSAFVAGGAMCERDVPPFVIVQGDRARVRALNVVGLERRGVPAESVQALERAFAALFGPRASSFASALLALDTSDPFVAALAGSFRAR